MLLDMRAHDPMVQAVFVAALFASIATWMVLRRSRQAQILQNEKEAAVRQDEREVWAMKQGAIEHRKTEQ